MSGILAKLDSAILFHRGKNRTITGIILGTITKRELKDSCVDAMGVKQDPTNLDINKFMGIQIIEDGCMLDRIEVIWK